MGNRGHIGRSDFCRLVEGEGVMDQLVYTQYEQLPLSLCASDIAAVLSISRANAYNLLRREDFPTLHIGKRMVVPKDRFIQWIEKNTQ